MSILCGTDFSELSRNAAEVAAHFAARTGVALHLVHAFDTRAPRPSGETENDALARVESELQREADLLRRSVSDVRTHVRVGAPDEVLLDVAAEQLATTIFVGALGNRREGRWRLGSHADRLAQRALVPVFVVRASDPISSWIKQERPLRVLIGADLSLTTERAMKWVDGLRSLGPCEIKVVDLYWPPEQFTRLGLSGMRDFAGPHPEVTEALERDLKARVARLLPSAQVEIRVEPHIGRVGDRIAALADDEAADLIVVGSHDRNALERVLAGSVSHAVLHRARVSVVCVPESSDADMQHTAALTSVIVATDFSASGNAAVAFAYSVVPPGGTVHLVHVINEQTHGYVTPHDIFPKGSSAEPGERPHAVVQRALAELIPLHTHGRVVSKLHVLESDHVANAICQAAERLDASAICLGTHGRDTVVKALIGSVSAGVLGGTRRPVLFAGRPAK